MKRNNIFLIGAAACLGGFVLICACLAAFGGVYFLRTRDTATLVQATLEQIIPTSLPVIVSPTLRPKATLSNPAQLDPLSPTAQPGELDPGQTPTTPALLLAPAEMLRDLENTIIPLADLVELAERLQGKQNIPRTLAPPVAPLQVGAQQKFWVMDTDTNKHFQTSATLRYITDHAYFWVEDDVTYPKSGLKKLADTFEDSIYPTNREFFGSEWTPGVDGDPHLYILYATGLGGSVAGYFSSADQFHPDANEYSNAHEMFVLSADLLDLRDQFTYGVLAHEFQHMIHWFTDRNEESWINEGFSELAAFLNGYGVGGHDYAYVVDPDIQLSYWPSPPDSAHYGGAFLFLNYFLDRFGEEATKALVANPSNSFLSIDETLAKLGITDPLTAKLINADDVFADWAIASYLQDKRVGDGRFTYHNYTTAPQPTETESFSTCPTDLETREVNQYGSDYIRFDCPGSYNLRFEGSTQVNLLPSDPYSGSYAMWSNHGDESDMTLTRAFDFSNVSGPITFNYQTWFDLETDYDYVYLEASTDGGNTWEILTTPSGSAEDPTGNSYGWGYTGASGGKASYPEWIQESVDLSQYAGKNVQLRFEYVTDAAVNQEGMLLDDISIPQIGYSTDFENDDGGWQADGFARIQNNLPQTFRISVIKKGKNTTVDQYVLSSESAFADNLLQIPIQIGGDVKEVIVVVSGTTRVTRQPATYQFELSR